MSAPVIERATGADGIAVLRLGNAPGPAPARCETWEPLFARALDAAIDDPAVRALVVVIDDGLTVDDSGDPTAALPVAGSGPDVHDALAGCLAFTAQLRRLERCGKPLAAVLLGDAFDAALDVALACHRRVVVDAGRARLGFTSPARGLLPRGGGLQRLARLIGIPAAGAVLRAANGVRLDDPAVAGLIDCVPQGDAVDAARAWVAQAREVQPPWDQRGFVAPGGVGCLAPHALQSFQFATARLARDTQRRYPARLAALCALFEGPLLPFDTAVRLDAKRYAELACGPVASQLARLARAARERRASGGDASSPADAALVGSLRGAFVDEGLALLAGGVAPALLENAARLAGYRLGPLAVLDDLSIDEHLRSQPASDGGADRTAHADRTPAATARTLLAHGRAGRNAGAGLYDYRDGRRERLWPGLVALFPPAAHQPDAGDLQQRLLAAPAAAAARRLEEGTIGDALGADLDAVLGLGYPAWTGGPLAYAHSVCVPSAVGRAP